MSPFSSPFASPFARQAQRHTHNSGLYQQVGLESRLSGASPHQMVAMLFDGYMEALAQAKGAIRAKDTLAKGQAIGKAVRIVEEGLRAGLDMKAGGSLARDLGDLYNYLAMRLTMANLRSDEAALDECQQLMRPLQEAWTSIAPQAGAASQQP